MPTNRFSTRPRQSLIFATIAFTWSIQVNGLVATATPEQDAKYQMAIAIGALRFYEKTGETKGMVESLDRASEAFGKAIKAAETYAPAYRARGRFFHLYRKDFPAARADLERAVQLEPDKAANHLSLVQLLCDATLWADAVSASDELLKRFDQGEVTVMRTYVVFHARECRKLSLLALGRDKEAAEEFNKIDSMDESISMENSGPELDLFPRLDGLGSQNRGSLMGNRIRIFRLRHLEKDEIKWTDLACVHLADRAKYDPRIGIDELQWLVPALNAIEPKTAEGWYGKGEVRRHIMLLQAHYAGIDKRGFAPAIADYDAAEKMGFKSPSMLFHRGRFLLELGNENRAIADLEACFRLDKAIPEMAEETNAMERAFEVVRKQGDDDRLLLFLDYCLKHPVGTLARGFYAERHQILFKRDRAEELLRVHDTVTKGGLVSFSTFGMPADAISKLLSHLLTAQRWGDAFDLLAQYDQIVVPFTSEMNHDLERTMLSRLIWEPSTNGERLLRAEALRYFGRTDEAITVYDEILRQSPNSVIAGCNRALAFLESGQSKLALEAIQRTSNGETSTVYKAATRGAVFQASGAYQDAIREYTAALEVDPYLPGVRGRRALSRLGDSFLSGRRNAFEDEALHGDLRGMVLERLEPSLCFPWRIGSSGGVASNSKVDQPSLRLAQGDILNALKGWEQERKKREPTDPLQLDTGAAAAVCCLVLDDPRKAQLFVKAFGSHQSIATLIPIRFQLQIESWQLSRPKMRDDKAPLQPANAQIDKLLQPLEKRLSSPLLAEDYFLLAWNSVVTAEQFWGSKAPASPRPIRRQKPTDRQRPSIGTLPSEKDLKDRDTLLADGLAKMKTHLAEAISYVEKGIAIPARSNRDSLQIQGPPLDEPLARRFIEQLKDKSANLTMASPLQDRNLVETLIHDFRLVLQPARFGLVEAEEAASNASRAVKWEDNEGQRLLKGFRDAWTTQDFNKAIGFLDQAAREKSILAFFRLGRAYERGYAVPEDHRQALRSYLAASSSSPARSLLGAELPATPLRSLSSVGIDLTNRAKSAAENPDLIKLPTEQKLSDDEQLVAISRSKVAKLVEDKKNDLAAAVWKEAVEKFPESLNVRLARLEFLAAHAVVFGHEEHKRELTEISKRIHEDQTQQRANLCLERLRLLSSLQLDDNMVQINEYRSYKPLLEAGIPSKETLGWLAFDLHDYKTAHQHLSTVLPSVEQELKVRRSQVYRKPSVQMVLAAADRAKFNLDRLKQQLQVMNILASNPEDAIALMKRANASTVAGWSLGAWSDGSLALISQSDSVLLLCWNAGQAMAYDQFEDAQKQIDAALKLNPSSAEAYTCRGALRQAECRFDEALADFDRAIQLSHCRPEPYFRRAQLLFYRGEIEQAFEALSTAILVEPPAYSLLLPQRLRKTSTSSAPPADPRIASVGPRAAEVAAAQLKLARGDVAGAEEDLIRIGDDAAIWKKHLRADRPEPPPQPKVVTYESQQDWQKLNKQVQEKFKEDQAAEWKAHGGQADWATSFTLGLARATRDEDQELFEQREHPMAVPAARNAKNDTRIELAHWSFLAADVQRKEQSAFADLIPSIEGPLAWEKNKSVEAEYRLVNLPLRHVTTAFRRSRLRPPLADANRPQYDAHKRFAAARDHVLTPASFDDLYAIVKGMNDELKAGSGAIGYLDRDSFARKALEKHYDHHLLTLAKQAEQLPKSEYVDPIQVATGLSHSRRDTLELLRSSLEESAKRQTDEARKKDISDSISQINRLLETTSVPSVNK